MFFDERGHRHEPDFSYSEPAPDGDEVLEHNEGSVEIEKKTPREMLAALLFRFHPDRLDLDSEPCEECTANQQTQKINEAWAKVKQGDTDDLQKLYEQHILGVEKLVEQSVSFVKDYLSKLDERIFIYLQVDNQTAKNEFNVEWGNLSEEEQKKYAIAKEINDGLIDIKDELLKHQDAEIIKTDTELATAFGRLKDKFSDNLTEILDFLEKKPVDVSGLTDLLLDFKNLILEEFNSLKAGRLAVVSEEAEDHVGEKEIIDDFDIFNDDDEIIDETKEDLVSSPKKIINLTGSDEAVDEDEELEVGGLQDAGGTVEKLAGSVILITTTDKEVVEQIGKLMKSKLVQGLKPKQEKQTYTFQINRRQFPWFTSDKKSFFEKNAAHHALLPHTFQNIKRPGTDEYFPEAIFLDKSGKALDMFVEGRFDEYLTSERYSDYQSGQEGWANLTSGAT